MTSSTQMSSAPFSLAEMINKRSGGFSPRLAIILGSGLGEVAKQIENPITIQYDELPNFSVSKILGQAGKLHLGTLKGLPVVCLEGRTHIYEGMNSLEVIKNMVRTLKLIGCQIMLTTNAAGSLNIEIAPGNLVLLKDHINFMFTNPLIGLNDERFGERFSSMDNAYDHELRQSILKIATKLAIPLTEGVLVGCCGPSFETHAEIRAFKLLGADVVAMSTIPEVIVARHCGIKVVSICAITNLAAGLSDEVLTHKSTLEKAKLAIEKLANLIMAFAQNLRGSI